MRKAIPMGISDYRELKENSYYAVDKSMMIYDFLKRKNKVTLITRPRRFGKTLNMSMLAEFFDITKDSRAIFKDTAIMETEYADQINAYPVIYLSFAEAKGNEKKIVKHTKQQIASEYKRYKFLFRNLDEYDQPFFNLIRKSLEKPDEGDVGDIDNAISFLSSCLEAHYHKKVMLFIDEYDTPFIEAHVGGFYDSLHNGLSILLSSALKNNQSLQYALLTGIQRVAKENIFSGLNNLKVCTVADDEYARYFGFTEKETKELLEYYGLKCDEAVKEMYNGYMIGKQEIYNPWSIINYADKQELMPYWINTSGNRMIQYAMEGSDLSFREGYERLIREDFIETNVMMGTSFFEQSQTSSLWGLFVNAGYLTIEKKIDVYEGYCRMRIPNHEVVKEFKSLTAAYLEVSETTLSDIGNALKREDREGFIRSYREILLNDISYHDLHKENSYHVFLLGMCISLKREYRIRSNCETGKGRADIILEAKKESLPNYIIEMKYTREEEKLKELAKAGVSQIREKRYGSDLKGKTIIISLAHCGKAAEMEWQEA